MTNEIDRRDVLAGLGAASVGVIAGCFEGDDERISYEITNGRSEAVDLDFELYDRGELALAQEYELEPGGSRRVNDALAGGVFEVAVTVDGQEWTYDLEMNGCEHQELSVVVREDVVEFSSKEC